MKRIVISLLLIFCICKISAAQLIRPEIADTVALIAEENIVNSSAVGYSGRSTAQWKRYVFLEEKATDAELILLTDNKNGVVRCYSFQALAKRKRVDMLPILIKHLTDTTIITTYSGCLMGHQMVGDYMYEVVATDYIDLDLYRLSAIEKQKIDSIMIFDKDIRLHSRPGVLLTIKPEEKYYTRLREIVIEEKNDVALVTLAKYKKPQDKELVIEKLQANDTHIQYFGLMAVMNFPDRSFYPYVENIHSVEIKKRGGFNYPLIRMLYQVIVQYKDIPSRQLLELTLNTTKKNTYEYHSSFIWLALELYPDKIYEGIQERIKISDFRKREFENYFLNK